VPSETLCVIPARGGSKGVPRKNVRLLGGIPLVGHAVLAARAATCVSRVVVSTDDREIAETAERFGSEVVWRPAEISGDTATSESALVHALRHLEHQEGYRPDLLVFVQCTSPFTTASDIDQTVRCLLEQAADTALTVVPFHAFVWRQSEDGDALGVNHDKRVRLRRQERQPEYLETGAVYVMRSSGFLEHQHRFFGKTALSVTDPRKLLEIDEEADFARAEALLAILAPKAQAELLPPRPAGLALDFDGVMTDNTVIVNQDGTESVICSRSDGMGIGMLRRTGLPIAVFSTEPNPVVAARCRKLQIPCRHNLADKIGALSSWAEEHRINLRDVVYVGNDVNDLECLRAVGCPVVPADAHPEAIRLARIVLNQRGGEGAVRAVAELLQSRLTGSDHGKSA
jgi:N-acylneuraminate cytidylyltransferase